MAITAIIFIAAIMAYTIITAILVIKAIRSNLSNKEIHISVKANMMNRDIITDPIASQGIPYIQVTLLTHSLIHRVLAKVPSLSDESK